MSETRGTPTKEFDYPILKDICNGIMEIVDSLSYEDLGKLQEECNGLNRVNCWWVAYGIRETMRQIAFETTVRLEGEDKNDRYDFGIVPSQEDA